MKSIELYFSLILIGNNYYKKFEKFTILSLKKNINNLRQKKKIVFFISTEKKLKKKISILFKKKFRKENYKIIFDTYTSNEKISYYSIGRIQNYHLNKIKNKKDSYLIFLYSDIIYSNNTFKYSINILQKNKKLSGIGSFAISLNTNKKFCIFFRKLLQNKNYLRYFLENAYNLISNFHKKYIYGKNINLRSNFICMLKKEGLIIKSQHYHPIIINSNKLYNKKIYTLDSSFHRFFKSVKEVYIEKNMLKLAIFSFDSSSSIRNRISFFDRLEIAKNKNISKKLFFLDLYYNLVNNLINFSFFSKNYVGLTFSKYLKIQSLNKFINYILNNKINLIKQSINNEKLLFKDNIGEINLKRFFLNYFIFLIKTKIVINNLAIIKYLNKIFTIGIINKPFKNDVNSYNLTCKYILIFLSYSIINKLKFIIRVLIYKNKLI